jgi:hypothetical protein
MKEIVLTQGKVALVDDDDFEWLNQWKWFCNKAGYAVRNLPKHKSEYMHRAIMKTPDGLQTDHVDHNKRNNQKNNLRICNNSQNQANRHYDKSKESGYRGVEKRGNKYRAHVTVNQNMIHLGHYENPEDAARVYNKAVIKYFGEFATINLLKD